MNEYFVNGLIIAERIKGKRFYNVNYINIFMLLNLVVFKIVSTQIIVYYILN